MSKKPDTIGYHKKTMGGKRIYSSYNWRPYAQTHRRKPKK